MSQEKKTLLIIEDDLGLQKQLRWSFDAYEVLVAGDRESALAHVRRHEPAVVTMDLGLPPDPDGATEGLAILQQILALAPDTKIIVLSGNQERDNAVKAIALGGRRCVAAGGRWWLRRRPARPGRPWGWPHTSGAACRPCWARAGPRGT